MSRKPRKCRICRKRPVWRGGDVKDPGPFCKKCYHSKIWPERKAALRELECEGIDFVPELWGDGPNSDHTFYVWEDYDAMLEVFFAGEVFEDSPDDRFAWGWRRTPLDWIADAIVEPPAWVNELTKPTIPPPYEPTADESPPSWLTTRNDGLAPPWPEEEMTEAAFVWPAPIPFSALNERAYQLEALIGEPVTPERLAHAWATGLFRR